MDRSSVEIAVSAEVFIDRPDDVLFHQHLSHGFAEDLLNIIDLVTKQYVRCYFVFYSVINLGVSLSISPQLESCHVKAVRNDIVGSSVHKVIQGDTAVYNIIYHKLILGDR